MIWGGADAIIIEIKCKINAVHLNHSQTIPTPHPAAIREKIVFHETSVKEVGDRCLTQHIADSPEY